MDDRERLRPPPAHRPLRAVVTVPGSKSIANRALVCAALADGTSELTGVPDGDDTVAMVGCLRDLGVDVTTSPDGEAVLVGGTGGALAGGARRVDARLAGTTSRFVTALAALAPGPITIDGGPPLRRRPMAALHHALRALGAEVTASDGGLPVTIAGGPVREGGTVSVRGDVSSQFLTALMLIGPLLRGGLQFELTTTLVSRPYVGLTAGVMATFGVDAVEVEDRRVVVQEGRYRGVGYAVEPDASSAGYPLAMAAVAGGRVEIAGLASSSPQSDVRMVDLLGRMGCTVLDGPDGVGIERARDVALRGVDVDLADASDLVPTVAVVAATASSPTHIRGVGFIRAKESDRLRDLADELNKAGARVTVEDDGLRIDPSPHLHGAVLDPHDDHRLAMAFGVLATAVAGIEVLDPAVVAKSWPDFWTARSRWLAGP